MNPDESFVSRHRRWIPFSVAMGVLLVCLSPLIDTRTTDLVTQESTMLAASVVFAFTAVLFGWMRHTMITDSRRLTIFGLALKDFFLALTLHAVVWSVIYGVLYALRVMGDEPSEKLRIVNRAAIIGGASLIIATGLAVAHEMRRAGSHLSVHVEPEPWNGEERRSGQERRDGWPAPPLSPG